MLTLFLLVVSCRPSGSAHNAGRAPAEVDEQQPPSVSQLACAHDSAARVGPTYANPLSLSYRFQLNPPSRREAADPSVVLYRDRYYLFASVSGGYFSSDDLLSWRLIGTDDLPLEAYAPTAVVIDDWLYFMASSETPKIYRTQNPEAGRWEVFNEAFPIGLTDPALFVDDDGRVYLYYGCSNVDPLRAVELDPTRALQPIGEPVDLVALEPQKHGWERPGDRNELEAAPWLEGAWMNKLQGKYYLQYAAPGTEYKSYADGIYVSERPLGPFSYAPANPFSRKPGGFIAGAGHGSTFADKYGNYWHIATMSISVLHKFERRLGLFPTLFTESAQRVVTSFGDFPTRLPQTANADPEQLATGWMLLSYGKPATASSTLPGSAVERAFDEEVRTHWSARSGDAGEWISVDLSAESCVQALQINLAEQDSTLLGRNVAAGSQYLVESSLDGELWTPLLDRTGSREDLPHYYASLEQGVRARYIRVTNQRVPSGKFAVSGLRVFGSGQGSKPAAVRGIKVRRSAADPRSAHVTWDAVPEATGYNVRFGSAPDALPHEHMIFGQTSLDINALDTNTNYWFAVDAFNENGLVRGIDSAKAEVAAPPAR